ncbi:MAG: hypothetical protein WAN94_07775, partial [Pseudolabrys sp.]
NQRRRAAWVATSLANAFMSDQKGGDRFPVNRDAQVVLMAIGEKPSHELWANRNGDFLIF